MKTRKIDDLTIEVQGTADELKLANEVVETQMRISNLSEKDQNITIGIAKKIYTKMRTSSNPEIIELLPEVSNAIRTKDLLYCAMLIKHMKQIAKSI